MQIDLPDIVAELTAAFRRYERALMANDVVTLNEIFRDDPRTIRYGVGENLYGHAEIAGFRAARSPVGLARTISRTVITTYGRDLGAPRHYFTVRPARSGGRCRPGCAFPTAGTWSPPT